MSLHRRVERLENQHGEPGETPLLVLFVETSDGGETYRDSRTGQPVTPAQVEQHLDDWRDAGGRGVGVVEVRLSHE